MLRTFTREELTVLLGRIHPKKQNNQLVGLVIDLVSNGNKTPNLTYQIVAAEILPAPDGKLEFRCRLMSSSLDGPAYLSFDNFDGWIVLDARDKPLDYSIRWHEGEKAYSSSDVHL